MANIENEYKTVVDTFQSTVSQISRRHSTVEEEENDDYYDDCIRDIGNSVLEFEKAERVVFTFLAGTNLMGKYD